MSTESFELGQWHTNAERKDLTIHQAADKIGQFVRNNPTNIDTLLIEIDDYPDYINAAEKLIEGIDSGVLNYDNKNQFWRNVAKKILDERPYSLQEQKSA